MHQAISERRLLHRIQLWLLISYIISFVIFEVVVGSATYVVMQYHTMLSAHAVINEEFSQKQKEAARLLADHVNVDDTQSPDSAEEMVTTWITDKRGKVLKKDRHLSFAKGSLTPVLTPLVLEAAKTHVDSWHQVEVQHTAVLVGVQAVANKQGVFLGDLVCSYSLGPSIEALRDLLRVDVDIAIGSVPFIFLLTLWLSRRSSRPIRTALYRQREFVNDAAHELRTPLTILRGTLELAAVESNAEEIRRSIASSLQEVDYISTLVGDLSTLARIESGDLLVNPRLVDLISIITEVVDQTRPIADARGIVVQQETVEPSMLVHADPVRLRQLLMILVQNAVKYNHDGGSVTLKATWESSRSVRIQVRDTGIGIPEEDLPHIFDRFYRGRRGRNHASGSGIGLAVAAWIVDGHQGRITVSSQVGVGTVFTVQLP